MSLNSGLGDVTYVAKSSNSMNRLIQIAFAVFSFCMLCLRKGKGPFSAYLEIITGSLHRMAAQEVNLNIDIAMLIVYFFWFFGIVVVKWIIVKP